MWIHVQSKIILKMKGDFWKPIIHTATKMNILVRILMRESYS